MTLWNGVFGFVAFALAATACGGGADTTPACASNGLEYGVGCTYSPTLSDGTCPAPLVPGSCPSARLVGCCNDEGSGDCYYDKGVAQTAEENCQGTWMTTFP